MATRKQWLNYTISVSHRWNVLNQNQHRFGNRQATRCDYYRNFFVENYLQM